MKKCHVLIFCILLVFLVSSQIANAESIQITTSKKTYNYGDYLSISINVSKVTNDVGIIHIIDEGGTKSSAVSVQIKNATTTITSPNPFDVVIFKEGKYQIEIEYAGAKGVTEFELVDAGNIAMPLGSNVVVSQWTNGAISDYAFLKFLADKNAIKLQDVHTNKENIKIPAWYKTNGFWWTDRKISDSEFIKGLQYLLDRKIIST